MFLKNFKDLRILFGFFSLLIIFLSANNLIASSITGIVFDKQRNPLPNVDVELQDQYYRLIDRKRTDGAGRYQFDGLSDGEFTVKAMPFMYDLIEQSHPVTISTVTLKGTNGNTTMNQDFYLMPRSGGLADSELSVVFSQEIPSEAKKMYEKGVQLINQNKAKDGVMQLNEAVKIFPNYFLALYRIGKELYIMKNYKDAATFFFKAAEVNDKSANSFYYLGNSLHNLGKEYNKSAMASLNQALLLAPSSMQVLYALGKVERDEGKLSEAEKHLLQAKKLAKNPIPEIHKELAQLYANDLKKYKEAADELESYIKASKLNSDEEKKTKKIISDLRAKAGVADKS